VRKGKGEKARTTSSIRKRGVHALFSKRGKGSSEGFTHQKKKRKLISSPIGGQGKKGGRGKGVDAFGETKNILDLRGGKKGEGVHGRGKNGERVR